MPNRPTFGGQNSYRFAHPIRGQAKYTQNNTYRQYPKQAIHMAEYYDPQESMYEDGDEEQQPEVLYMDDGLFLLDNSDNLVEYVEPAKQIANGSNIDNESPTTPPKNGTPPQMVGE